MRCLVTGGSGFIGSNIQDKLLEIGHEVIIVDNLRSGKKENIDPKSKFIEADIQDFEKIKEIFTEIKPEAVFHLAAQNEVPYSMTHPVEDAQVNILGMINLLEASKQIELKKFIYSNTGGAFYGDVSEDLLPLDEGTPVKKPSSFYGVSKLSAEMYLRLYGNLYKIPWVSLRYANVYGPRQAGNREAGVVAIFLTKMLNRETPTIFGDGGIVRDYIYVGDVVEANIKALDYKGESDAFNISTAIATTTKEVFEAIESELKTGIKPIYGPERAGDTRKSLLAFDKAKRILRWEPEISFLEGIKRTANYYKNKAKNS